MHDVGGKASFPESTRVGAGALSHFNQPSALFTRQQHSKVLLSDLGILLMLTLLFHTYRQRGLYKIILLYLIPYLWVHHWISVLFPPFDICTGRLYMPSSRHNIPSP